MNFLTNLDMNQNQIMNVVLQKLAVAPSSPTSGQMYFNTVEERAFIYNGKEWVGMDSIGATMTGESIVATINLSSSLIDDKNLSQAVRDAISKSHSSHTISDVTGLQGALDSKETPSGAQSKVDIHGSKKDNPHAVTKAQVGLGNVDNTTDLDKPISTATQSALDEKVNTSQVKTDVPIDAEFTDTVTTINGKTGEISKADIVALGIPAQDTTYTHPSTHPASIITESDTKRFVTDAEKAEWNAKETPSGATAKASAAEDNAKGYTDSKIADLIGSAPETLDTLHEIAEALGDDPNFATTILDRLAEKTKKYVASIGDNIKNSFVLTHNLNTRDVNVMIRQTASPYAMVMTDVEMTTVDTVTIKFAEAPASSEYTVTIVG